MNEVTTIKELLQRNEMNFEARFEEETKGLYDFVKCIVDSEKHQTSFPILVKRKFDIWDLKWRFDIRIYTIKTRSTDQYYVKRYFSTKADVLKLFSAFIERLDEEGVQIKKVSKILNFCVDGIEFKI